MKNPYFDPDYNPYPRSVLIGTSVLFIFLTIAAVSLRFYSRSLIKAKLGIDDWITIPSMVICIGLAVNQIIAFQCFPVSTFWDLFESEYGDHCVVVQDLYLAVAVSDMLLDITIFILPIPHLWTLQLPLRQKLAVGGIFFLGSIVVACGITRVIVFKWVIRFMTTEPMLWVTNTTWYSAGVLFWHLAENVVGLVGCCLPTYRPFFLKHLPKLKLSTGGSSAGTVEAKGRDNVHHAVYYRQNDEVWPVETHRTQGTVDKTLSTNSGGLGFEGHELHAMPLNRIVIQREFRTETSAV
ncbi:hypothetical protein SLS53_000783 [Cytospora paraplurivora]|uniref:Rhodopsin domain-containing protein n=1 Tax=Cytospora paraplurivora TaxID=2898453 RepID=A0AAN9YNF1_9PEZI